MSVAAHAAPPGDRPAAGGSSARGLIVLRRTTAAGDTLTLRQPLHLFPQLQQPGSGSNINLNQVGGASVSSSLYDSGNTALKVNCVVGCSATSGFTDNSAFTAGTTSVNNISGVFNDSIAALTTGNAGALRATSDRMLFVNLGKIAGTVPTLTGSSLNVNCTGGCGGPATFADNSTFTAGTTSVTNIGAVFNDGLAAVTSGNAAAPRITSQRGLHVNLRNNSGTEIATSANPLRIDPTGTTTQPVSGTVTANAGTGTFTVSGTVTANVGTTNGLAVDSSVNGILNAQASATSGEKGPLAQCAVTTSAPGYTTAQTDPLSCNTSGGLRVDGSGVTKPVSGTVTANQGTPANWAVNEAQIGGSNVIADPCQQLSRSVALINLTAGGQIITATASKQTYICSLNIVTATAQNIALVEGTGTTCGTGTAGMAGGATAATGWNFAANGGMTFGNGGRWLFKTATAADNVCLLLSGTGQTSGSVTYVQL